MDGIDKIQGVSGTKVDILRQMTTICHDEAGVTEYIVQEIQDEIEYELGEIDACSQKTLNMQKMEKLGLLK